MYQLTREDLANDSFGGGSAEKKEKAWVNDKHFKNGETVDFNIVDFALMEMKDKKTQVPRFHAQQKMMVLSGEFKGKEYTYTWWDVLEPGDQNKPGRSLSFLTTALKNLGIPEELLTKPVTEALGSAVGGSLTATCNQVPKKTGDGHYTNWHNWQPLI